jgi:hypothetical protein
LTNFQENNSPRPKKKEEENSSRKTTMQKGEEEFCHLTSIFPDISKNKIDVAV